MYEILWKWYYMVNRVLSSVAERAVATVSDQRWGMTIKIPELYMPTPETEEARILDEAFKELGYASLNDYYKDPKVGGAIDSWAKRACAALERTVRYDGKVITSDDGTIVVGGHAVMLNALAYRVIAGTWSIAKRMDIASALYTILGEAEAIVVEIVDGVATARHLTAQELGHPTNE